MRRSLKNVDTSFSEWLKRFELVTGEDGCRVGPISGGEDESANNNTKLKTATENSSIVNTPTQDL